MNKHDDQTSGTSAQKASALLRWLIQTLIYNLIFGAALFLPGLSLRFTAGWVYLAVFTAFQLVLGFELASRNPALITQRTTVDREQALSWDRPLTGIMGLIGPLLIALTAGFDFANSLSHVSFAWQAAGALVYTAGGGLSTWALLANRHFYSFVRIEDEGHTVIDSGPYRLLRHPGYAGSLLYALGAPLLLDSAWALLPGALIAAAAIIRTALEDRYLHKHLPGYSDYAARVRWKLLPGVW